jgi:hypothetical protein
MQLHIYSWEYWQLKVVLNNRQQPSPWGLMKLNATLGLTYTRSLNEIVSPLKIVINYQNTN